MIVAMMAAAAFGVAGHAPHHRHHAAHRPVPSSARFISYARAFEDFADATASQPEAERVRRFHQRFGPLAAGFYRPRDREPARLDASIARALTEFPSIRVRYDHASASFEKAFVTGQARFRKFFPDYRLTLPVYLLHSLGEMDGGTRELEGRTVAIFGADVIAKIHDDATIGPFLDHELFHTYHARYFPECSKIWCSLWAEGLAVYVTSTMNPAATDRDLLLTIPQPIRPAIMPRLAEAMCGLWAKLDSTAKEDYGPFFYGQPNSGGFPPRYGYLLGLLLVQKIGTGMTPEQLAKLPPAKVRPLLDQALASYGPCPAGVTVAR